MPAQPRDNPSAAALAPRILALRRRAGFTQIVFAHQLAVSQAAVSRWEKGLHAPDEAMLARIAALGGITTASLRYGEAENHLPATSTPSRRFTDQLESTICYASAGHRDDVAVALQVILDKCRADDRLYPENRRTGDPLPAMR